MHQLLAIAYLPCVTLQIGKAFCRGRNCSLKRSHGWPVVIEPAERRDNTHTQVGWPGFVGEWSGFGVWEAIYSNGDGAEVVDSEEVIDEVLIERLICCVEGKHSRKSPRAWGCCEGCTAALSHACPRWL